MSDGDKAEDLGEDVPELSEDEQQMLAEQWRVFRHHFPVGAYLPVGQLDGDCRECGGAWPCESVTGALAGVMAAARAEGWDEGLVAAGDSLMTLYTSDPGTWTWTRPQNPYRESEEQT